MQQYHIVRGQNPGAQAAQHNDAISFPVNCIIMCNLDDFVRRYHVFVCLAVSRCQQVTSDVVQTASGINLQQSQKYPASPKS